MRKGGLLTNLAAAGDDPLRLQYSRLYWRYKKNVQRGYQAFAERQHKELVELRKVLEEHNSFHYPIPKYELPEPVVNLPPIDGDWSDPIAS
jgi:hypothetical protein